MEKEKDATSKAISYMYVIIAAIAIAWAFHLGEERGYRKAIRHIDVETLKLE